MKKRNLVLFGTAATLSLAIAGSIGAVTVSATSVTNPTTTGSAEVTYSAESTWTIEIPETITVGTPTQITASGVNTVNGSLTITVSSANSFNLKDESEEITIPYELKVAEAEGGLGAAQKLTEGGTVLTVSGASGSTYIGAYVTGNPSTGGEECTDTLTFTIAES